MVSDVLAEAVEELDHYLNEPDFADVYFGPTRARLGWLRDIMDSVRRELDTVPEYSA